VLALPGMSLNATIFPDFGLPTMTPDFSNFVADGLADRGTAGPTDESGMGPYVRELDRLIDTPLWKDANRRIVVGHSFGGMLALSWILRHGGRGPARVDGMVLVGTTAGPMFEAVRLRLLRLGNAEWRVPIAPLMHLWNSTLVTRTAKWLLSRGDLRHHSLDFRALEWRSDLAVGLAGWRATAWQARRSYRTAMWDLDLRPRLEEVTVRTIVLHGAEDHLFPILAAHSLASGLANAELRIVAGAAHVLPLTHGDEVVRAVRDLIS
jgi:pimeloyl-ACP methyl ester carboxylesterase